MKEIYTPMERILIEGTKALTTKEVCQAALETKEKLNTALLLDEMLLKMEEKQDMMDGVALQEWIL